MDQICACCGRVPTHETEKPDWIEFIGRGGSAFYCPDHKGFLDTLVRAPKGEIIYTYRGQIERGADYHWVDGYSPTTRDNGVLYPWNTIPECRREAKRFGCKAVFVR